MTADNLPPHLTVTTTDRGFAHLPPIPSKHDGDVTVYESSTASGPHIWLKLGAPADDPTTASHAVHLTAENAWLLADQLRHLVANHYQGDARPPAAFVDPTVAAPATLTEAVEAAQTIVATALAVTLPEASDSTLTVGIVDVGYITADLDPGEYREAKDDDELVDLLDVYASDIDHTGTVVEPDGTTHSLY